MDKNHHLGHILGGHAERIGDWTPQQLRDYIQNALTNDPTMMPGDFGAAGIDVEHLTLQGRPLQHAVSPRALTMGDAKGLATPVYGMRSGSLALNQAYHAASPGFNQNIFAESFDGRDASASGMVMASGTARYGAVYVPVKSRLTGMHINYSVFEVGGTFTYGGYAIYGPLENNRAGATNKTALPQRAITEVNLVSNFRATGPHFVANGLHAMTGGTPWSVVLDPGIYFAVVLYVFSVAPTTQAEILHLSPSAPGVATFDSLVAGFTAGGLRTGRTTLPATLDLTAYSNASIMWCDFFDDDKSGSL